MFNNQIVKSSSIALIALFAISGCGESTSSSEGSQFRTSSNDNTTTFDKKAMITQIVDQVITPTFTDFKALTEAQVSATLAYCDAAKSNTDNIAALKEAAQQSWQNAMNTWQQIEVMQVGPLLTDGSKLRNKIYSWPLVGHCAVDQDVAHFENGEINGVPYDITRRTDTRRGLDALEYLLFNESLAHSCSSDALAPSGWNARPEAERLAARCSFAVEVANDLTHSANELLTEWTAQDGFAAQLTSAGENSNTLFPTANDAINHISDSLFYIDSVTKDAKMAVPIGLQDNSCNLAPCINDIESTLSANALSNIKNNLIGFSHLFLGHRQNATDGLGFDDYLIAADAANAAQEMQANINAAIEAIDSAEHSFQHMIINDQQKAQDLHQHVKNVTDQLKTVFITTLALDLPETSAGDND
ncbi:imelysin family protein [Flocculibacter collagenilyticus]|uniref:imelysin family protein n=1 Tax=Flocculibacter collagenilyticus TaxID=2744479 RepID=UPI0018F7AA7C|nr:imelysin family protein [Flocculibacter collagenilyticus]